MFNYANHWEHRVDREVNSIVNGALHQIAKNRAKNEAPIESAEAISSESRVQENPKRGAAEQADEMVRPVG